ncbi:MAG: 16S rRNA (guanine(966)-N(2))-methyltransferase RsmD [Pseudomonadota bacterium]
MGRKSAVVRIISGEWRSRLIRFPDIPGLRPTPDAVRETVFNWLQNHLPNSNCLDLFAGSGALGFESRSRGASKVDIVESNTRAFKSLRDNHKILGADTKIALHNIQANNFLDQCDHSYDIVFLDPPYEDLILPQAIHRLHTRKIVKPGSLIYIEHRAQQDPPVLPDEWNIFRSKRCGEVMAHLTSVENLF